MTAPYRLDMDRIRSMYSDSAAMSEMDLMMRMRAKAATQMAAGAAAAAEALRNQQLLAEGMVLPGVMVTPQGATSLAPKGQLNIPGPADTGNINLAAPESAGFGAAPGQDTTGFRAGQGTPVAPSGLLDADSITNAAAALAAVTRPATSPLANEDRRSLENRATSYGDMPKEQLDAMSDDELRNYVTARRQSVQEQGFPLASPDAQTNALLLAAQGIAAGAIGATRSIIDFVGREPSDDKITGWLFEKPEAIPTDPKDWGIWDTIRKSMEFNQARAQLDVMHEQLLASFSKEDEGYLQASTRAGEFAGMIVPYEIAGAAMSLGMGAPVAMRAMRGLGPISRGAIHGAGTAFLAESGTDKSIAERAAITGAGGLIGGSAAGLILAARVLAGRVRNAFGRGPNLEQEIFSDIPEASWTTQGTEFPRFQQPRLANPEVRSNPPGPTPFWDGPPPPSDLPMYPGPAGWNVPRAPGAPPAPPVAPRSTPAIDRFGNDMPLTPGFFAAQQVNPAVPQGITTPANLVDDASLLRRLPGQIKGRPEQFAPRMQELLGEWQNAPGQIQALMYGRAALADRITQTQNHIQTQLKEMAALMNAQATLAPGDPYAPTPRHFSRIQDILDSNRAELANMLADEAALGTPSLEEIHFRGIERQIRDISNITGKQMHEWQDMFVKIRTRPTSSYNFAKMMGTLALDDKGDVELMLHGTPVGIDGEVDMARMKTEGNILGPGLYLSNSAQVTSGSFDFTGEIGSDMFNITDSGYAMGNAHSIALQRSDKQRELSQWQSTLSALEQSYGAQTQIPEVMSRMMIARDYVAHYTAELNSMPVPAPNVRMYYIASKNVLNLETEADTQKLDGFFGFLKSHPEFSEYNWDQVRQQIEEQRTAKGGILWYKSGAGNDPGVYEHMRAALRTRTAVPEAERAKIYEEFHGYEHRYPGFNWQLEVAEPGRMSPNQDEWTYTINEPLGQKRLNDAFVQWGIEVFEHTGGLRAGSGRSPKHRVRVALTDRVLFPAFMSEELVAEKAKSLAISMGKEQAIVGSPLAPELAGKTTFDNTDVLKAKVSAQPHAITVLKGVGDISQMVQQLVSGNPLVGDITPQDFRIVEREGRLDLLVNNRGKVTEEQVRAYEKFGLFEGARIVTANGKDGVVLNAFTDEAKGKSYVQWRSVENFANKKPVTHKSLLSNVSLIEGASPIMELAPKYDEFREYVLAGMLAETAAMGGSVPPGWLDRSTTSMLPTFLATWMSEQGITGSIERAAVEATFNLLRVRDFQSLAPDEMIQMQLAEQAVAEAPDAMEDLDDGLQDLALAKGFAFIPNADSSPGGMLEDLNSAEKLPFGDRASAMSFLQEFDRPLLPSPLSDMGGVPLEVAESNLPSEPHGGRVEPGAEEVMDAVIDEIALGEMMSDLDEAMGYPQDDPFANPMPAPDAWGGQVGLYRPPTRQEQVRDLQAEADRAARQLGYNPNMSVDEVRRLWTPEALQNFRGSFFEAPLPGETTTYREQHRPWQGPLDPVEGARMLGTRMPPPPIELEPQVPKGHTRLYRGQVPKGVAEAFEAVNPGLKYRAPGIWVTRDRNLANWYITDRVAEMERELGIHSGRGTMQFIDIPTTQIDQYLASKNPEAALFSGDPMNEYVLPFDLADQFEMVGAGKKLTATDLKQVRAYANKTYPVIEWNDLFRKHTKAGMHAAEVRAEVAVQIKKKYGIDSAEDILDNILRDSGFEDGLAPVSGPTPPPAYEKLDQVITDYRAIGQREPGIDDPWAQRQDELFSPPPGIMYDQWGGATGGGGAGAGGGGGGIMLPPPPPPPPPGGAPGPQGGSGLPAVLPQNQGKHARARMMKSVAMHLGDLTRRYDRMRVKALWPMRRVFQDLEENFARIGGMELRPWRDYQNISTGMDKAHNDGHPFYQRAAGILNVFDRPGLRKGWDLDTWSIADNAVRLRAAQNFVDPQTGKPAPYSADEIQAMGDLDTLIADMVGPPFGFAAVFDLKRWISIVRAQQARGLQNPYKTGGLFSTVDFFVEQASATGARFEGADLRLVINNVIRSFFFHQHVKPHWDVAHDTWREVHNFRDGQQFPLRPLANVMLDWMQLVRRGYEPGQDLALEAVEGIFRGMGVPLTRKEASEAINGGLNWMHRSFIGWRVPSVIRDSTQPLLALPRVGPKYLLDAYRVASLPKDHPRYQVALQRAMEHGWIQEAMPQLELPGVFEPEVVDTQGRAVLTPGQEQRREFFARIIDRTRDVVAPEYRQIQGTKLDPMYMYNNVGVFNRLVTGEAAWLRFMDKAKGMGQVMTVDAVMAATNADTFTQPVQRLIREHLAAANLEQAAAVFAREVANSTQFRYGIREAPQYWRTHTMRIAGQFGNFSVWTLDMLREAAASKNMRYVVSLAGMLGGMHLTYKALEKETGWKFGKFSPLNAFTFAGGPSLEPLSLGAQALSGGITAALGGNPTPEQKRAVIDMTNPLTYAAGAARANPAGGAIETVQGVAAGINQPNPFSGVAQYFITGDRRTDRGAMTGWGDDLITGWIDQQQRAPGATAAARGFVPPPRDLTPGMTDSILADIPDAQGYLDPEERQFLEQIKHLPGNARFEIFSGYLRNRRAGGSQTPNGAR